MWKVRRSPDEVHMSLSWRAGLAGIAFVSAATYAAAQMTPGHHNGMAAMGSGAMIGPPGQPTSPGQDAFGAIQEIVRILDADPNTDWSKVDIAALREHLIDMNEVTLHAAAGERFLADGVDISVTGEGRTLEAIKRMIPAHVHELNQIGLTAKAEELPNGVRLVVTAPDAQQVAKLKALGFMGIMTLGSHHQPHHLMIAKGELVH
jgi:hypothetical protein